LIEFWIVIGVFFVPLITVILIQVIRSLAKKKQTRD
jgi:hypothetical protein